MTAKRRKSQAKRRRHMQPRVVPTLTLVSQVEHKHWWRRWF